MDDVLYAAEPSVLQSAAIKAADERWKRSPLEIATTTEAARFCGMETFQGQEGGYHVVQKRTPKNYWRSTRSHGAKQLMRQTTRCPRWRR